MTHTRAIGGGYGSHKNQRGLDMTEQTLEERAKYAYGFKGFFSLISVSRLPLEKIETHQVAPFDVFELIADQAKRIEHLEAKITLYEAAS